MKPSHLLLVLAFLAGAAASWALRWGTGTSRAEDGALDTVGPALVRIEERLASLEERLPESAMTPGGNDPRAMADLASSVRELQVLVEEQLGGSRESRLERLLEVRDQKPEADWGELEALLELWAADPERAEGDVRLLSETRVLERFGPPTTIYRNQQGLHWVYGRYVDPVSGANRQQLLLILQDGYVTSLEVPEQ